MMPRITGVSRLARRRNSMRSFVTIALDEVAVIPAMIRASLVPHPTHMPKPKPAAMLMTMRVPPESNSARAFP